MINKKADPSRNPQINGGVYSGDHNHANAMAGIKFTKKGSWVVTRKLRNRQLERGEIRIEDIKLNRKSRDDVPALLFGLQYLYSQKALRDRLFAIMNEYIRPGVSK